MFQELTALKIDPARVQNRCLCGSKYSALHFQRCPACGRGVPAALSVDGGVWKSYREAKIDSFRQMLAPGALDEVPTEHRDQLRKNIERQIRLLEDGSWKDEVRHRMKLYFMMLEPDSLERFPSEERDELRTSIESAIQLSKQELEAAGESL